MFCLVIVKATMEELILLIPIVLIQTILLDFAFSTEIKARMEMISGFIQFLQVLFVFIVFLLRIPIELAITVQHGRRVTLTGYLRVISIC